MSEKVLPKYLQIAGQIRDRIVRGDLAPGDEVPSERELAAAWSVARPTASRALESLRQQGLVESRKGAGTFVRSPHGAPRARERYERARELGTMYGRHETVEFLTTDVVEAPAPVTDALSLPRQSEAARRVRLLRGLGAVPIEISTSWFPAGLLERAPRLLVPERLLGGTGRYIEKVTGRRSVWARDQVAARLATAVERDLLQLDGAAAVLVYHLTVLDQDDRPVQFDEAVHPPETWTFRQEYSLEV